MKALIYGITTLVVLTIGMQVASNMASSVQESVNESTSTKYNNIEQQYLGN